MHKLFAFLFLLPCLYKNVNNEGGPQIIKNKGDFNYGKQELLHQEHYQDPGTAILAVIVAMMIANSVGGESKESFGVMTAFAVACISFGWPIMRNITSGLLVWGWVGILLYYMLMLLGSAAIGVFVLAYRLIKDSVCLMMAIRAEKNAGGC